MNQINDILPARFGLWPTSIREVRGGWTAKAYRVDTEQSSYFLKVYDKSLPSIRYWIGRIGVYMPVLGWLSGTPELGRNVIKPIRTLDGQYKAETDGFVYLLFDYVTGETPGSGGLTAPQTAELAGIIARLHNLSDRLPREFAGLDEDVSLPFCEDIERYLGAEHQVGDLSRLIGANAELLHAAVAETVRLRDEVRLGFQPLVLCHADAHPNNVMQSDRLIVVDWEDMRLAPAETDLILYAFGSGWPINWPVFRDAYLSLRPGFHINSDLMRFYLIRRRLDDVCSDITRLSLEQPGEEEAATMYGWLDRHFTEIRVLLDNKRDTCK